VDKKFKKILDSNTNNSENFKKVMGALDGARAILNESITPELKKEMNEEQLALLDEAMTVSGKDNLAKLSKKLEKLTQNIVDNGR